MPYTVETYGHRDEWLPQRGLGGSDAACILGLNQYKPPVELWAEQTGKVEPPEINPIYALTGHALEPVVLELLEGAAAGHTIWRPGARRNQIIQCRSNERPWQTYTPDAVVLAGERRAWGQVIGPIEAKSTAIESSWEHRASAGAVRAECQVHHGFAVLGAENGSGLMAAILANRDFAWFAVEWDQDIVEHIIEREEEFLELVERDIPPDYQFSEDGAKMLAKLLPYARESVVELGGAAAAAARDLGELIKVKKTLEDREKVLRQRVMHDALVAAGLGEAPDLEHKLKIETQFGNWTLSSHARAGYEVQPGRVTQLRQKKGK